MTRPFFARNETVCLDAIERKGSGALALIELADDTYATLVTLASGDKPPTELRMFEAGETDTTKGKFTVDLDRVMKRFREMGKDKLPFDYGHAMVSYGGDQRAAAWFVPEVRGGELWAVNIEWTPRALRELGDKEWRFYSPAFRAMWPDRGDDPAIITELINCALTNLPATKNQKPIVASEDFETDNNNRKRSMKLILQKLGVSEEGEAIVRVDQLITGESANVALLSSFGFKNVTELASAFSASQETVKKMKKESRDATIAQLSKDGRLPPAQHDFARMLSDEQFSVFVAGLPESQAPSPSAPALQLSAPPSGAGARGVPAESQNVTLTDEELEMGRQFGQSPEELLKTKKELLSGTHPFRYEPKQPAPIALA
jgi:phage I-like protein